MQLGRVRLILVTAATAAALLLPLIGQGLQAFTDLGGHWAASAVAALQARGLISGYPDGGFNPNRLLNRAELAKLLATTLNQETDARALAGVGTRFPDVPAGHWASGYIEVLAELNLVRGDAAGNFQPDRPVTRAEMAALLARAAGIESAAPDPAFLPYTDVNAIPAWARSAVAASTRSGLLTGDDAGFFRPNDSVTRAEASTAMLRLLAYRGSAFQIVGVLITIDSTARRLTVRDNSGQLRTVPLAGDASLFRQGAPAGATDLLTGDQVWIYIGPDGLGRFVDARFRSSLGDQARVQGNQLTFLQGTTTVQLTVQSGALVFVNGKAATLGDVDGAQKLYVGLDASTGEARLVDAVFYRDSGVVRMVQAAERLLVVSRPDNVTQQYTVAEGATIFRNGLHAALKDLSSDDQVLLQTNPSGSVIYIQAERQPG